MEARRRDHDENGAVFVHRITVQEPVQRIRLQGLYELFVRYVAFHVRGAKELQQAIGALIGIFNLAVQIGQLTGHVSGRFIKLALRDGRKREGRDDHEYDRHDQRQANSEHSAQLAAELGGPALRFQDECHDAAKRHEGGVTPGLSAQVAHAQEHTRQFLARQLVGLPVREILRADRKIEHHGKQSVDEEANAVEQRNDNADDDDVDRASHERRFVAQGELEQDAQHPPRNGKHDDRCEGRDERELVVIERHEGRMHQKERTRERAHAQAHERAEQQCCHRNWNQLRNEIGRVLAVPAHSHEAQLRKRHGHAQNGQHQSCYALGGAVAFPQQTTASLHLLFLLANRF